MKHMEDATEHRFPRLAPILFVGVLVAIAIIRPGNLAGDSMPVYRTLTTFAAAAAVGYIAWRFHGILPAGAAILLLCIAEPAQPVLPALIERGNDAVFLVTLALGIGAGSRQGRTGRVPWIVLAVAAVGLAYFGWYGWELFSAQDSTARERVWQLTAGLSILSVVVGFSIKRAGWRNRLGLLVVVILLPASGLVAARLVNPDGQPRFEGGDWRAVPAEWSQAVGNGEWVAGTWAWTLPWVVAPLMVIGFWRTLARGWKEYKGGRPPLPWLLGTAGLAVVVAFGARPLAPGSLALAAVGALLSVFGVADLIQALVERIELRPPEPGPSDVPRVN